MKKWYGFFILFALSLVQAETNNSLTLQTYEIMCQEYFNESFGEVYGSYKLWIDKTLTFLPQEAQILEIGSATGRDASYMESHGFTVERTDATQGFIDLLQQRGFSACFFNILTDEFDTAYDLIFANRVFLHFTPEEMQDVFNKIHASLKRDGILSFSLIRGEGDEWITNDSVNSRYYCYWYPSTISPLLHNSGFTVLDIFEEENIMYVIAKKATGVMY